jgi:hypothetical protein
MFKVVFELSQRVLACVGVVLNLCVFRNCTSFRKFFDIEFRGSGLVKIIVLTICTINLSVNLYIWLGGGVKVQHRLPKPVEAHQRKVLKCAPKL